MRMVNDTEMAMEYTYSDELVSDLHKDAYGSRPRGDFYEQWSQMTPDEKQAQWDRMISYMEDSIREEQAAQAAAIEITEARVADYRNLQNASRAEVIRWLAKINGCTYEDGYVDLEHLCYRLGVPFGYFKIQEI